MISSIHNALLGYIIPSLPDRDLCSFTLASKECLDFSIGEISKRTLRNQSWFNAVVVLNGKINEFLKRESQESHPLIEKIHKFLVNSENVPLFFFLSSHPCFEEAWTVIKKSLDCLHYSERMNTFFSKLQVQENNVSGCISLLERYELKNARSQVGPHPYIYIDTNYSSLSVGNLAFFSVAQKQLDSVKKDLLSMDQICQTDLMNFYNHNGHKSITLCCSSKNENAVSEDFLNDLTIRTSLLKEVRMLELTIAHNQYDDLRIRPCFLSILEGANQLPHLNSLLITFYRVVTDLLIGDLSKNLRQFLLIQKLPLNLINVHFEDITLLQVQTLISHLNAYAINPINLHLTVSHRRSQHMHEIKEQVEILSTPLVHFRFFTLI